jgi:hypothetical protein
MSYRAKKRYFVISGEKDTRSIIIIWHAESTINRQIRVNGYKFQNLMYVIIGPRVEVQNQQTNQAKTVFGTAVM